MYVDRIPKLISLFRLLISLPVLHTR